MRVGGGGGRGAVIVPSAAAYQFDDSIIHAEKARRCVIVNSDFRYSRVFRRSKSTRVQNVKWRFGKTVYRSRGFVSGEKKRTRPTRSGFVGPIVRSLRPPPPSLSHGVNDNIIVVMIYFSNLCRYPMICQSVDSPEFVRFTFFSIIASRFIIFSDLHDNRHYRCTDNR